MDQFFCKSLLFLLVFIGCSAGQDILPEGPVDAIVGENVTIKTLIDKSDFAFIIWNFNHAGEQTHIAVQTASELSVNAPYEGRVSINKTNGYLTLGPLKSEDSGDYSINALTPDGTTRTGEIKLRVLGCPVGQDILSGSPVDAILGRTVTLKTQIVKSDIAFIIWNFNVGSEQIHIATQTASGLKVNAPYEGRVSINKTNGYLTLGPLKSEDSGTYSINTLTPDGTTHTEEITLRVLGCPVGQDILPESPVDAILGRTVTLKTQIVKSDIAFIIWNFNVGSEQIHIATQTASGLKVNAPYEGRVSINKTNGYLTLGPLKSEDSGTYSINTLTPDGTTHTEEITLRVLAPTTSSSTLQTFSTPEPTRQCTGTHSSGQSDVWPLVACVVVIAVLLAGYLLLLCRWIKHRNLRNSNSRNIELSVPHEKRPPHSEDYQTLNPASRDRDQIYSTLSDT